MGIVQMPQKVLLHDSAIGHTYVWTMSGKRYDMGDRASCDIVQEFI